MASLGIGLINGKGGVGKSALSICLAAEAQRRGEKTLLVDLDPQASTLTWGDVAQEHGEPIPDVIAMGDAVRTQLPGIAEPYDRFFVDSAGRISKRSAGTLMVVDLALIPIQPSITDVWALEGVVEMVQSAQELRPHLVARVVINKKRPGTVSGATIADAVRKCGLDLMETSIGLREDIGWALAEGRGPTTHAGGSVAALEIRRLYDECEDLILGVERGEARAS